MGFAVGAPTAFAAKALVQDCHPLESSEPDEVPKWLATETQAYIFEALHPDCNSAGADRDSKTEIRSTPLWHFLCRDEHVANWKEKHLEENNGTDFLEQISNVLGLEGGDKLTRILLQLDIRNEGIRQEY